LISGGEAVQLSALSWRGGDRMTKEEFDNTKFHADMQCIYKGKTRELISVDFEERLIGLVSESDPDMCDWVRCENINLIVKAVFVRRIAP
jgi:hypothetical protein